MSRELPDRVKRTEKCAVNFPTSGSPMVSSKEASSSKAKATILPPRARISCAADWVGARVDDLAIALDGVD